MDQESEGTSLVIFVVGGVVLLLLLLLGGAAFFFFASRQEDSIRTIRKEVEAAPNLKEINQAVHDFKPDDRDNFIFPVEGEKTQNPNGEFNTFQDAPQPKGQKQELPKGPVEQALPPK